MDALYGHRCGRCGGFTNSAEHRITFSPQALTRGLQEIFGGFNVKDNIQADIFRETLRLFNQAAARGISEAYDEKAITDAFLEQVRHNNEVFSAFRTHRMQNDIARQLLDGKGQLKSYEQFRRDVEPLTGKYCDQWLNTEYNTAVIRAHRAADWKHFETEKDVYPNLRWMPTTSAEPDPAHMKFWSSRLTLPVDDPFWDHHHPGERWGCKCTCEQTDEPVNDLGVHEDIPDTASKGLHGNPGQTGQLFSEDHPYYPKNCGSCPFTKGAKNRMRLFLNKDKDCGSCQIIEKNLKKRIIPNEDTSLPPALETYIKDKKSDSVFISQFHGKSEMDENILIGRFISRKLGTKVYLLPRLDSNTAEQVSLRRKLLPSGVFKNKNPDFLLANQLFEAKSMPNVRLEGANSEKVRRKIQEHIKRAVSQADNVIIEIPDLVKRRDIYSAIKGYLASSNGKHIVIAIWKKKVLIYHNIKN